MESMKKLVNRNYLKLQRHAFSTNSHSQSIFHELDHLIRQKESFINYIKFEYSVAIIFNLTMSISTFIYLNSRFSFVFSLDMISTLWLILVNLIMLLETIPKIVLIYQTVRISQNNNDSIMCSRRLMHMTRSNIYYYNTVFGYCLLSLFTLFFLLVRRPTSSEENSNFYNKINIILWGFCFRLVVSFVNYYFYFNHEMNEADIANNTLYIDYNNRVSPDILEKIETHSITSENLDKLIMLNEEKERDVCCICMNHFSINDFVKILPCNSKHVFHKTCIEKWLTHNKACPTCRKEVTKKTVEKLKMF